MRASSIHQPIWLWCAVAGALALGGTLTLPWHEPEFRIGAIVRILMALAGIGLLILAATRRRDVGGPVTTITGVLGICVLAYPSLLSLAAARIGGPALGPVIEVAGAAGHVLPLTLVQVIPMLASSRATGRSRRRWLISLVVVAGGNAALSGLSLTGVPGAAVPAAASTVLWFGSFTISPVATWSNVRGTSGATRLRAIVAALASVLPVLIIVWCVALGVLASSLGWAPDAAVGMLMVGFSLGCRLGGLLSVSAIGPADAVLLSTRSVIWTLDALIALLLAVLGSVAALLTARMQLPTTGAVLVGAAVAVTAGIPWQRAHAKVARMVDPSAELRHELSTPGTVADGQYRTAVLHVLRRLLDDPGLVIEYDPATPAEDAVVLATGSDDSPTVTARPGGSVSRARLVRLGDCSESMRRALLEDRVERADRRARGAAEVERSRLSQNLHDGLQGRLLGLALNLQLTARQVDDPTARLVIGETVDSLRDLVADVRALGGGQLPALLVDEGLGPAIIALLHPWRHIVDVSVPPMRLESHLESTAYFVVGEAVTNGLKHAAASRIDVRVTAPVRGQFTVTVRDDGRGGADPRLGSGLRGIGERVVAVGGAFVVREAHPRGTIVEAVLPCGS